MKVLLVMGKQGAGLRAEHASALFPEASRARGKQRDRPGGQSVGRVRGSTGNTVEAVWGGQVRMDTNSAHQ